jgi:hypothetical protein
MAEERTVATIDRNLQVVCAARAKALDNLNMERLAAYNERITELLDERLVLRAWIEMIDEW